MAISNPTDPLFKLTVAEFNEYLKHEVSSILKPILENISSEFPINQQKHSTLNIDEAVELLKVSKQTIYQNIKTIPHRKIFGRLVFLRDELLEFIENNGKTVRNKGDPKE